MYQLMISLIQPYLWLWFLTGCILLRLTLAKTMRFLTKLLLLLPFALWTLISLSPFAHLVLSSLEGHYQPREKLAPQVKILIVLSGGLQDDGPNTTRFLPATDTLQRCAHAVRLYRQQPCKILVSGGHPLGTTDTPTLAEIMRDYLLESGIPSADIIMEDQSTTTFENARFCQPLLTQYQNDEIGLITDATHMLRSMACFQKQGIDPVPLPCRFRASDYQFQFTHLFPNALAADNVRIAYHEWMGYLWYKLKDRC